MRIPRSALIAAALLGIGTPSTVLANKCYVNGAPPGTYAACGYAPGYYRPQQHTLRNGRVERAPGGSWYAPSGRRQQHWNQYDSNKREYGPREPNPYGRNGRLSVPRSVNHVVRTRVIPRLRRNRGR
jgi:hypothetical protein